MMCRLLEVSRSGFYAWLKRPESCRARENRSLVVAIRAVHAQSKGAYGSPRIHEHLRAEGQACGRHRVARLMQAHGIVSRHRRKFRHTTDSGHAHPVAENLLGQRFIAPARDRVWVSDITYIWTREGWLYLAAILDLFSRRIVGWQVGNRLTSELVLGAFHRAVTLRNPGPGLICHSDRGIQYACKEFQKALRHRGMLCSMSGAGNCYDNTVMESFFHTLKVEWVHHRDFQTRAEARRSLFEYIEMFYNSWRRHSTLGMVSPAEFERLAQAA